MGKSTQARTTRKLKPRDPVIVAPVAVSQLTSEHTIGINASRYLEACRRYPEDLRPAHVGRLVVTQIGAWPRLLAKLADRGEDVPDEAPGDARPEVPDTEDAVLAAVGFARKP